MKIQGTFLTSRVGRRIFWTLLLAASVPIGLFGAATYNALADHYESQARRQQLQVLKFAGMGVLDRLVVARTVLEIAARTELSQASSRIGKGGDRVLSEVAHVDEVGRLVRGSTALWQRWRDAALTSYTAAGDEQATLAFAHELRAEGATPVLMAVRRADHPGQLWIAEVDAQFLFGELAQEISGTRICVYDSRARPLYCPGASSLANPRSIMADTQGLDDHWVRWNLFLRSDFGVADWTLVRLDAGTEATNGAPSLARNTALGALAALMLVVVLGLRQVRKTMVPLERLIAGTRLLSNRDYAARVELSQNDEFGELARSFNHMAERIGHQVQAMRVQSAIDREILNGLDVARVLQQVARRLEQLVPGAAVVIVELVRTTSMLARLHRSAGPFTVASVARADALCVAQMGGHGPVRCDDPPRWLVQVLPRPAQHLQVHCAKEGDTLLGLLVLGIDDQSFQDPDIEREIGELCDRVSVTLASADRERRLVERATRDSLTGLANRAGLHDFIEHRLAESAAAPFSVLFIDLDRFKEVNDSMGHQVGDELLRAVAQRLQACAPPGTLVARPGGDEFVLVVPGPRAAADAVARGLCGPLADPVPLSGRLIVVGASMGLAHHPEHGRDVSDLMRRADMAMYSAKAQGGGTAAWFEATLDARLSERTALQGELRLAMERHEFELHFQPRLRVDSGAVCGAEALLRWHHRERGLVSPTVFIDLLEQSGQIDAVGLWAIEQSCAQLRRWRDQGIALDSIAVNVSTRQLHGEGFADRVNDILRRHGLPASCLELEVTESIFMGDSAPAIRVLQRLRDTGVHIALDDFGTGYSSLSYLHKLPIGILKVDRSFVIELGQRDSALAVARSIVALARALRMRVVAEGVETAVQARLLIELGCDEVQGFLYARPLVAEQFTAFAAGHRQWAQASAELI